MSALCCVLHCACYCCFPLQSRGWGMAEQPYMVASDSETTGDDKSQSAFHDLAIGIEVGTSKCSIAVWNGARVELLRNTRKQKAMRSFVMFKDDMSSGGASNETAYEEKEILSGSAIFNMKRLIGRADTDPIVHASKSLPFVVQTLGIGVKPFIAALVNNVWKSTTPEEVLAIFLVELKTTAEVQLKRLIRNVVLTIPVSFNRFQQIRVERACAMAGLHVLRLMPEPAAVALLYAQQQQQQQQSLHESMGSGCEKVALIFNMGAGYCDVATTATAGGVSQIKAMQGFTLGGEDILKNVLYHLLPNFDSLYSIRDTNKIRSMGLLRIAAQDAIHKLSTQSSVQINVDLGDGTKVQRVLHQSEFEEVNRNVFEICEKLIKLCLADSKLAPEDINDVILVGGCSRIPKIRSLVLGLCEKEKEYEGMDALEAAVTGAALEGAVASGITDPSGSLDMLTIQATPLSLGIRVHGGGFVPIIQRNTAIPVRKSMIFTTAQDGQTEALIVVYEGDGKMVEENHLMGYFKVTAIPPVLKGTAEISVCMDIDAANMLRVFAGAMMPGTDRAVSPFFEVRMPTLDDGHGWCAQALVKTHGSALDLTTIPKELQPQKVQ
ncbi:Hsp70 protein [Musa troglodytarum]|uniref:Hsp70 protein n=1 Tax=Musa troglodytarum TaxID=320322 RepID=A0A9E7EWX7_9LILI|nr:Hsp70 protein [Musa troglodytarum]